jgi:chromosome segregation protein
LGSGLGTKSYSIIQQGNIGAIIDAGPDERRYFIEEAAGTTRYKNRKNEALRKISSTHQNLLRVSDIISEIHRQMASLKRQARKAERFKRYRTRADELDIRLSLLKYMELNQLIEETDQLQRELKDADIEHTAKLKKLDAVVEGIKLQRSQQDQEIASQKTHKFDLVRRIDRSENDIDHLKQEIRRLTTEANDLISVRQDLEGKNNKIDSEINQTRNEISRLQEEIESNKNELHNEQAEATEIKSRLENLNAELETSKAALMDRLAEEARYKNIFQNAANTKENLQRRLKRAGEEAVTARTEVEQCRHAKSVAGEELTRLTQQAIELKENLEQVRIQSDDKRDALGHQVKHTQSLELKCNNAKSKFTTLKKMEENYEWYRDGVKAIMTSSEFKHSPRQNKDISPSGKDDQNTAIIGLLADIIDSRPEYQPAVEAVLGESLQYILVNAPDTGVRAIEYLQTNNSGRSGFIPVDSFINRCMDRINPSPEFSDTDFLLDHLCIKEGYEKIAEAYIGHILVAGNIHEAYQKYNSSDKPVTVVTKEGDIISQKGAMIGGSKDKLPGILAKKQELRDLEQQIVSFEEKLVNARNDQNDLEREVRRVETELQQIYEQKTLVDTQVVEAEKALYRVSEELKHAVRHLEIVDLEHEQLLGEESDIDDELAQYNNAIEQLATTIDSAKQKVAGKTRQLSDVSAQLDSINQKVIDHKLTITSLNARWENNNNTLRRLKEFQQDGAARLISLDEDIVLKNKKSRVAKHKADETEIGLSQMYEELKELERVLEENEFNYSAIDAELKDRDSAISELESKRDKILENSRILDIEQTQRRVHCENVIKRLEEQHRRPFEEFKNELKSLQEQFESENSENFPTESIEEELHGLLKRINNIGDVNLAAINEYEQLKSRHDFLVEQREDLQKAIDDLHKVVKKINRITQQRFIETFNLVNEKLIEVFPRLFDGGNAKIVLTEPEKPLETGVEFMIHPPGKKLTRMSLLSGGEKALSAIAFIFSLFLIRPASFCLMDEIDAPLDEANVYRFNNLLKLIGEQSQIIMVTHNKKSMEFADMLFGITMETKGVSKVVSVNLEN